MSQNDREEPACGRLGVFARFPEPGRAKTRLIPALGPEGAAAIHAAMVRHTLETVDEFSRRNPQVAATVYHAGGDPERLFALFGAGHDYRPQADGDLGDRIRHAFSELLAGGSAAVLIGTDCPALSPAILRASFDALESADLVLGPAADGGYYLIGLRAPAPELFERMPWGTARVLAETRARARRLGLELRLLETLDDVDGPGDLPVWEEARARRERGDATPPTLTVVIPALDESACIGDAVRSALRPGVEVVVADGGSVDGTPEIARSAGARVVVSPRGRGPQQDAGAALARGRALLFLHADTTLPADYLEVVSRTLADVRVALGAFRLRIDRPGVSLRLVEAGVRLRCAWLRLPYGDQALFLRAETYRAIGGFPDVPLMEDVALVGRARTIGRVVVVREAVRTSGRRWTSAGVLRMTFVNLACLFGARLGIPAARLMAWRDDASRGRGAGRTSAPPEEPGREQRDERQVGLGCDRDQGAAGREAWPGRPEATTSR